jgi:hypothetical protein
MKMRCFCLRGYRARGLLYTQKHTQQKDYTMSDLFDKLDALVQKELASDTNGGLKNIVEALTRLIAKHVPLPPWSTLSSAAIKTVEQASVGSGVAIVYKDGADYRVLMLEAGEHYGVFADPHYMIPGGFNNLNRTEGSKQVQASDEPESPQISAAREIEEEVTLPNGQPLFEVDPSDLVPMDTKTFRTPRIVMNVVGLMWELPPEKAEQLQKYLQSMKDADFRSQATAHTVSRDSNKREIADAKGLLLNDLVDKKINLKHPDQLSLFKAVKTYLTQRDKAIETAYRRGLQAGFGVGRQAAGSPVPCSSPAPRG